MPHGDFEALEKKPGLKKQIVEIEGKKYLVSTVDLLPPEMRASFSQEIVTSVEERGRYETSIFPFKEGEPDLSSTVYAERYESKEDALNGHERIINKLKKGEIDLEE